MEEDNPPHLPFRWETPNQQWWYATPIDLAAAAGHYDVLRSLLTTDASLLLKLTSLRRIRRLETIWNHPQLPDLSRSRSNIAKLLLSESETSSCQNALTRAGYGGWLLYAAGNLGFVNEILRRDRFLLPAAARSGRSEVLWKLRESAIDASLRGEACEGFEKRDSEEKPRRKRLTTLQTASPAEKREGSAEKVTEEVGREVRRVWTRARKEKEESMVKIKRLILKMDGGDEGSHGSQLREGSH